MRATGGGIRSAVRSTPTPERKASAQPRGVHPLSPALRGRGVWPIISDTTAICTFRRFRHRTRRIETLPSLDFDASAVVTADAPLVGMLHGSCVSRHF